MSASEKGAPRRVRQQRAHATLDALVTAGELLLDGRDPETVGVDEILARAGASASSFYQRFGSKQAFFDHLHERFCARIEAETRTWTEPSRWAGQRFVDMARTGIAVYLAFRRANAGALRSFEMLEAREPALLERRRAVDEAFARRTVACVVEVERSAGRAPPAERIALVLDLAVGRIRSAANATDRVQVMATAGDDELVEALATALAAYLEG